MKKKKKVLRIIIITLLILIFISGGAFVALKIYYNSLYNNLLKQAEKYKNAGYLTESNSSDKNSENKDQAASSNTDITAPDAEKDSQTATGNQQQDSGSNAGGSQAGASGQPGDTSVNSADGNPSGVTNETKTDTQPSKKPEKESSLSEVIPPVPLPVNADKVEKKAESIVGTDVAIDDYLVAGVILMSKLSWDEIKFVYSMASDGMYMQAPVDEIKKIQKIVFSKLSEKDIMVLSQIGRKYGKKMYIIDKNIDVEKYRAGYYEGKLD